MSDSKAFNLPALARLKLAGEKIAAITAYDASFARLVNEAGCEVVLVGDSLGMVVQGHESTLPVTVDEVAYHSRAVARGNTAALLVTDMPALSYGTPEQALDNAGRLLKRGRAQLVKLEGAGPHVDTIRLLSANGVGVCAHLGLLPQSVHRMGGYRVQGRDAAAADRMVDDALALEAAGAGLLIVECIPAELGARISETLRIPVIGIGAGPYCDGQILVLYDLLGITPRRIPRFARDFLQDGGGVRAAIQAYVAAVKDGSFPAREHCF